MVVFLQKAIVIKRGYGVYLPLYTGGTPDASGVEKITDYINTNEYITMKAKHIGNCLYVIFLFTRKISQYRR